MSQRAVFFLSTLTGLGLFAAVAHIQIDSWAFTSRPRAESEPSLYAEVPVRAVELPTVVELPDDGAVLTLPPLEVFGSPKTVGPRLEGAATTPAEAPHEATVPCSEWRDLGPRFVNDGVPEGVIRVRNLC